MAGFLSGVSSLLNNPAVQQLLPTVAGGVGNFLAAPAGTGTRGRIGRGLIGLAQGYEEGEHGLAQAAALKERAQHNALLNQKAQQAMQTGQQYAQANHDLLLHMLKSPESAQVLKTLYGWTKPEDIPATVDPKTVEKIISAVQAVPKEKAAEQEKKDVLAERERADRTNEQIRQEGVDNAKQARADSLALRAEIHADRAPREAPAPVEAWDPKKKTNVYVDRDKAVGMEAPHKGGAGGEGKPEHAGVAEKRAIDTITKIDKEFDKEYGGKPYGYGTTLRSDATKEYDDARAAFYEKKGIDPDTGRPTAKTGGSESLPTLPAGWSWKDKDKKIAIDEKGKLHQHVED